MPLVWLGNPSGSPIWRSPGNFSVFLAKQADSTLDFPLCSLGLALAEKGYQVTLVDPNPPLDPLPQALVTWVAGDVRIPESLQCFQGAAVVFHVASYGMSGRQSLQHRLIQEVNIQGEQTFVGGNARDKVGV